MRYKMKAAKILSLVFVACVHLDWAACMVPPPLKFMFDKAGDGKSTADAKPMTWGDFKNEIDIMTSRFRADIKILEETKRAEKSEKAHRKQLAKLEKSVPREYPAKLNALKKQPKEQLLKKTYDLLRECPLKDIPLVQGMSASNLLALVKIGRHDCTQEALQQRRDTCVKLAGHPALGAFCTEANELSTNWCGKPVSIVSPFARLHETASGQPEDTPQVTKQKLETLADRLYSRRFFHYQDLKPEEKAEIFDGVYEILRRASDKRYESFNDFDTLDLVSIDESKCTPEEMARREGASRRFFIGIGNAAIRNFCLEAHERSLEWCRKSGLPVAPLVAPDGSQL